jgi:hypothetical protein
VFAAQTTDTRKKNRIKEMKIDDWILDWVECLGWGWGLIIRLRV